MIRIENQFIYIDTKSTSMVLEVKPYLDERTDFYKDRSFVTLRYYGKKTNQTFEPSKPLINVTGSNDDYNIDYLISSSNGNGNNEEPLVLIENTDGTIVNRFFYKSARVIKGGVDTKGPHSRDVLETLEIVEEDDFAHVELVHYFSIFKDSNVIASKKLIRNKNKKNIAVLRAFSLELPIYSKDITFYSFDGSWLFERSRHEARIKGGSYMIDSKIGSSSNRHNPFVELYDHENKMFYGFNLIFSGNHKEILNVTNIWHSSFLSGINDFGFKYELKENEEFMTPEAIMVIDNKLDGITSEMHGFVNNHIIDPKFKEIEKPVLYNSWEGTGMNIDEKFLTDMADVAKEVGIEQFVMDDGWFKGRVNDTYALGDWYIDKNKFPNGLKPFSDKCKQRGLKFGIWVEPEMICILSDLYKAHPEFACIIPSREPIERRHQLNIDMSNPKVVDYLFDCLSNVFNECDPYYVKWDYNRTISDPYSSIGINYGEYMYKYIFGTYSLIERLKNRFPNILFESCSSGGARYDLGMLYYMPQTWGSDDTCSYFRTFITCGTLVAYPQSTFGAHVSRDISPKEGVSGTSSLEDRFNLNCIGAFGYEFDLRKLSDIEREIVKTQIKFYKEHRKLLQYGDFFVVDNVFDDERYFSYIVTSKSKSEAMLMIETICKDVPAKLWKAKNLKPNAKYLVEERKQYNVKKQFKKVMSGKQLMNYGINIGKLSNRVDEPEFDKGIFTRLFYIKEVK